MEKQPRRKLLFVIDFNYGRELVTKHAYAYSGRQAKVFGMRQLAKDHGVNYSAVAAIFNGDKPNFDVRVDSEWRQKNGL